MTTFRTLPGRTPRAISTAGLLLLAAALSLGACGGGGGGGPPPFDGPISGTGGNGPPGDGGEEPAPTGRELWDSLGITDYRVTVQRVAFTPPDLARAAIVEVRGGQVVSRTYESDGQPVNPQFVAWWPDVEGLFDLIETERAAGADRLEVIYDPDDGHPVRIDLDRRTGLADDEESILTWNLTLL